MKNEQKKITKKKVMRIVIPIIAVIFTLIGIGAYKVYADTMVVCHTDGAHKGWFYITIKNDVSGGSQEYKVYVNDLNIPKTYNFNSKQFGQGGSYKTDYTPTITLATTGGSIISVTPSAKGAGGTIHSYINGDICLFDCDVNIKPRTGYHIETSACTWKKYNDPIPYGSIVEIGEASVLSDNHNVKINSSFNAIGVGLNKEGNDVFTTPKENYLNYNLEWVKNKYTVIYNANGGTGNNYSQNCDYDTSFTIKSNSFSRTGYTFLGWNTKSDGTGCWWQPNQSAKNLTSVKDGTVNLYAMWGKDSSLVAKATTNGTYYSITDKEISNNDYIGWTNKDVSVSVTATDMSTIYVTNSSGTRMFSRYYGKSSYAVDRSSADSKGSTSTNFNYLGWTKDTNDFVQWFKKDKKWYLEFYDASEKQWYYCMNSWVMVDNKWYFMDNDGYMVTGNCYIQTNNNTGQWGWYHFNSEGVYDSSGNAIPFTISAQGDTQYTITGINTAKSKKTITFNTLIDKVAPVIKATVTANGTVYKANELVINNGDTIGTSDVDLPITYGINDVQGNGINAISGIKTVYITNTTTGERICSKYHSSYSFVRGNPNENNYTSWTYNFKIPGRSIESNKDWAAWWKDSKGWYLEYKDVSEGKWWCPKDAWVQVDGKYYFFDDEGYMVTGKCYTAYTNGASNYVWNYFDSSGAWNEEKSKSASGTLIATTEGTTSYKIYAIDKAGNSTTFSFNTKIDKSGKIKSYTIKCIDKVKDTNGKVLGNLPNTKERTEGGSISGSDWGSDTTVGKYYAGYYYSGCSNITVSSTSKTVERYFTLKQYTVNVEHYVMDVEGNYSTKPTKTSTSSTKDYGTVLTAEDLKALKDTSLEVAGGIAYDEQKNANKITVGVDSTSDMVTTVKLYYKRLKHNAIFNVAANGGYWTAGNSANKVIQIFYEASIPLDEYTGSKANGFRFTGWSNKGADTTEPISSLKMGTSDVTLYALYIKSITVTFVDCENTRLITKDIVNNATSCTIDAPKIAEYKDWTNTSNAKTVGYNSIKEIDKEGATKAEIKDAQKGITVTKDMTYYAVYSADVKLEYVLNGGTENDTTVPVSKTAYCNANNVGTVKGTEVTLAECTKPEYNEAGYIHSYTFAVWAKNSEDGERFASNSKYMLKENTVMYAMWDEQVDAITYYIEFDGNAGSSVSNVPDRIQTEYDQEVTLPTIKPERTGFTFLNWNSREDGDGTAYEPGQTVKNLTTVRDSTVMMYAQWKQKNPIVVKTASSSYKASIIKRTYGDDSWYEKTGNMNLEEIGLYNDENCEQVWNISNEGIIERIK